MLSVEWLVGVLSGEWWVVSGESQSFSWLATLIEQGMVERLVVVARVVLVVQFSVVVVELYHVGNW